jgi:hypothetical protein
MEVPGKSTEVPGGCTEVPDNCQELPWSRKKSLYGCHENAAWQQLTDRQLRRMAIEQMEQVGVAWCHHVLPDTTPSPASVARPRR